MFGRRLEETLQVEARLGGSFVPVLVHRCVKFIREHGEFWGITCTHSSGQAFHPYLCL